MTAAPPPPRLVRRDELLPVTGSFDQCGSFRPDVSLEAELDPLIPEVIDLDEVDPVDTGNRVNGESWGWLRGSDRWWLVPLGFRSNGTTLAMITLSNEESMFDGPLGARATYRSPVTVIWYFNAENIEEDFLEVLYGVEPAKAATYCFERCGYNTFCPCCNEMPGLVVDVTVDQTLAPEIDQIGWAAVWKACPAHAAGCTDGYVTWTGKEWRYANGTAPAQAT